MSDNPKEGPLKYLTGVIDQMNLAQTEAFKKIDKISEKVHELPCDVREVEIKQIEKEIDKNGALTRQIETAQADLDNKVTPLLSGADDEKENTKDKKKLIFTIIAIILGEGALGILAWLIILIIKSAAKGEI